MRKKILAVVLALTLCLGMTGCSGDMEASASLNLITIEGETDLYYYSTTNIVYIAFNRCVGNIGCGYMSPYYSKNGKLCTYDTDTKQIVEIEE